MIRSVGLNFTYFLCYGHWKEFKCSWWESPVRTKKRLARFLFLGDIKWKPHQNSQLSFSGGKNYWMTSLERTASTFSVIKFKGLLSVLRSSVHKKKTNALKFVEVKHNKSMKYDVFVSLWYNKKAIYKEEKKKIKYKNPIVWIKINEYCR